MKLYISYLCLWIIGTTLQGSLPLETTEEISQNVHQVLTFYQQDGKELIKTKPFQSHRSSFQEYIGTIPTQEPSGDILCIDCDRYFFKKMLAAKSAIALRASQNISALYARNHQGWIFANCDEIFISYKLSRYMIFMERLDQELPVAFQGKIHWNDNTWPFQQKFYTCNARVTLKISTPPSFNILTGIE